MPSIIAAPTSNAEGVKVPIGSGVRPTPSWSAIRCWRMTDLHNYPPGVALGRGKTEHDGPRDMSRKHGHWGDTEEAKAWASRARRRDEKRELADARHESSEPPDPD